MKTLKTLLAVSLLVSSIAPSFAMDSGSEAGTPAQSPRSEEDVRSSFGARLSEAARGAGYWLKDGFALDYLKGDDEVRHFDRETLGNNKANLAKTAGLYAAVAAALAGAGYGVYKYFFANEDESSEEEAVVAEPVVNTTPAKDKAPKTKKPVVKPVAKKAGKTPFKAPRGGRFGKSSRVKKHVSRVKAKKSCKSCK